jgi:TonB family protein
VSVPILNSSTSPSLLKAWATSGLVHGVALGLLAIGGARIARVELATTSGEILLEASFSETEQPESWKHDPSDVRLVVMPRSVQRADQTFRFESTEPLAKIDVPRPVVVAQADVTLNSNHRETSPRLSPTAPPQRPRKTTARARVEEKAAAETTAVNFRHNPPPVYPTAAYAAGIEGTVLLRLTVASDGRVARVEVLRSSGHPILDGAAVNTVKQWRGEPARRGGEPIETIETLPVRFQLR